MSCACQAVSQLFVTSSVTSVCQRLSQLSITEFVCHRLCRSCLSQACRLSGWLSRSDVTQSLTTQTCRAGKRNNNDKAAKPARGFLRRRCRSSTAGPKPRMGRGVEGLQWFPLLQLVYSKLCFQFWWLFQLGFVFLFNYYRAWFCHVFLGGGTPLHNH